MRKKMRYCGSISKTCIFVLCNESSFTADSRTLYCKRKYSIGFDRHSTGTNQVVKGMKQFRAEIHWWPDMGVWPGYFCLFV